MGKKLLLCGALAAMLWNIPQGFAKPPAAEARKGGAALVIVFKDGHRQTFNLGEIDHVEFPGTAAAEASGPATAVPPRGHYVGKWEVGDGSGGKFQITLKEGGDAERTLHAIHGRWVYVDGEARITWNDGAMDAIRKVGASYQKFAYQAGKKFTDVPDNVAEAHLVTEKPI